MLAYKKPFDVVDAHLAARREYLERNYAAGVFLLSGRKEPRDGGVILANAASQEVLQEIIAQDPFHVHGVAEHHVVQFTPTMSSPVLETLVVD